jgi:hypothetical protein
MQKPGAVLLARNAARIRWITPVGIAACALLAIVGFAAARRVLAPPAVVPPAANPPIALIASAATTAPAEAQQRQVLAAIYTLQHFNAFIMARHWTAAIHTLVQIGSTSCARWRSPCVQSVIRVRVQR